MSGAATAPARASETFLAARDVSKSYGSVRALRSVSLEVGAGELVAVLGANGAGKTTLISIVAGLVVPDGGSVTVAGLDIRADLESRERIGLAPQQLGIYLQLTVRRNLRFFAQLGGVDSRLRDERVEEVADALELTDLLERRASDLSGGQQRRLHTAMALLHRPQLLLLDEPTAGVDVRTRNKLLDLVRSLAASGTAVIYTTHYLQEVETLDASVVILDDGEVIARGRTRELIARTTSWVVAISLDGDVPPSVAALGTVNGPTVRIPTADPAREIARAVASLGGDTERIVGIEVEQPSLESVYLAITGRRYDAGVSQEAADA